MTVWLAALRVGDEPDAWRAAGFTVGEDGACRIGEVEVLLVGRDTGKRILAWSFGGLDAPIPDDVDGLPTFAPPAAASAGSTGDEHPNGVIALDHLVLISPDLARTTAALGTIGLEPRRTRSTDTYGAPMQQVFFRAGTTILELIGPEVPSEGPAAFFDLAHTVADLDATATLLGDALGAVKDAVQPGRRIATLRHRDVGMSVATAFMSPDPN